MFFVKNLCNYFPPSVNLKLLTMYALHLNFEVDFFPKVLYKQLVLVCVQPSIKFIAKRKGKMYNFEFRLGWPFVCDSHVRFQKCLRAPWPQREETRCVVPLWQVTRWGAREGHGHGGGGHDEARRRVSDLGVKDDISECKMSVIGGGVSIKLYRCWCEPRLCVISVRTLCSSLTFA